MNKLLAEITAEERSLALEIMSCPQVNLSLDDITHPCHKICNWQKTQLVELNGKPDFSNSIAHRPEPWTGRLSVAKVVVLASNPSFSGTEAYPTWHQEWDQSKLAEFGADRFTTDESRGFGAIDSGKNRDRTINLDGTFSKQVAYWTEIRGRVAEILGKDKSQTSAIADYVMTELVHCKSHSEFGVSESLKHCSDLWLDRIMALSPANLVIVMGVKPAKHLLELFPGIPTTWGSWKEDDGSIRGYWPTKKSLEFDIEDGRWNFDSQKLHTVELVMGGKMRKVLWLPRPNSSYIRNLSTPGLIDERLFEYWRS